MYHLSRPSLHLSPLRRPNLRGQRRRKRNDDPDHYDGEEALDVCGHVVVPVQIGDQVFRCVCDSGAGRDVTDKKFAWLARRSSATRDACKGRYRIPNPRRCDTVIEGQQTAPIESTQKIELTFFGTPVGAREGTPKKFCAQEVKFSEMADITEDMILGRRTLGRLGFKLGEKTIILRRSA